MTRLRPSLPVRLDESLQVGAGDQPVAHELAGWQTSGGDGRADGHGP